MCINYVALTEFTKRTAHCKKERERINCEQNRLNQISIFLFAINDNDETFASNEYFNQSQFYNCNKNMKENESKETK